jgi:tetratricopeptide (TPR) repeat protein
LDKSYPFSSSAPELTVAAVGTCTHMAPEQFRQNGRVDARVDVYAFGVMLYQMICGELPFWGETWEALEDLHTNAPPPYLTETNRDLAELVQTCLAKEPGRRYPGFGKLREVLATIYTDVTGAPCPEPEQGKALTAVQWNNKGTSLSNLGKQAESIHCYEVALELDPTLSSAWFNKGVSLFESKKVSEALACYELALKLNPKSEQIWSNKGVALKSLGKIEEAIACYNRALQLNPRYANSWINKGVLLRALGKIEEALACYDRALRLDPANANAWTNKGNILFSLRRIAESLDCYDHALSLNSALALTWLNKGIALDALAKHEDALQCYSTALEMNPRLEQAWFRRGMTMVNAFQLYREAVPYFEEAERLGVKEAKPALVLCQNAAARGSYGRS